MKSVLGFLLNTAAVLACANAYASAPVCPTQNDLPPEAEARGMPLTSSPPGTVSRTHTAVIRGQNRTVTSQTFKSTIVPSKGTVVYLCGGPGMRCSAGGRPPSVPPAYDVVTLDYLGLASNSGAARSADEMSIEAQGDAVVSIVQSLKLSNYAIYGHSFGSAVATDAASKLTHRADVEKPKSVVLEGVIGRPTRGYEVEGYERVADAAWSRLEAREKEAFTKAYGESAKGMDSEQRNRLELMMAEILKSGPRATVNLLREFGALPAERRLNFVLERTKNLVATWPDPNAVKQYQAAWCQHELPHDRTAPRRKFFSGLVPYAYQPEAGESSICDCPAVPRPWDPKDHPIKGIPIVYINGEFDAPTPPRQAREHFDNQKEASQKVFISVKEGGHWETNYGRIAECTPNIFGAALSGDISKLDAQKIGSGDCFDAGALLRAPKTER